MKHWNKSKRARLATWHVVDLPKHTRQRWRAPEIKHWCQWQESPGRFYWDGAGNLWYFELAADASWFALKWM
jgi:hypothetical protein